MLSQVRNRFSQANFLGLHFLARHNKLNVLDIVDTLLLLDLVLRERHLKLVSLLLLGLLLLLLQWLVVLDIIITITL